jgi:hypothetical protein
MADLLQDAVSLFLLAAFAVWLLLIPIIIFVWKKPDFVVSYLYNLRFWQTVSAGFFVIAFIGYLQEGFQTVALDEWDVGPHSNANGILSLLILNDMGLKFMFR